MNIRRAFSLFELLVTLALGLSLCAMMVSTYVQMRKQVYQDAATLRIHSTLDGAMELISRSINRSGSQLAFGMFRSQLTGFPHFIEVVSGINDQLILKRGVIVDSFFVCDPITAGSTGPLYVGLDPSFAGPPTPTISSGCENASVLGSFTRFQTALAAAGGTLYATIWTPGATSLENVKVISASSDAKGLYLITDTGISNSYTSPVTAPAAVSFNTTERFRIRNGVLELLRNDSTTPMEILYDVTGFQVWVNPFVGPTIDAFAETSNGLSVGSITISLTAKETVEGGSSNEVTVTRTSTYNTINDY